MIPFSLVIFRLMVQIHPHVEVGSRNRRATTKWMELFDRFFDRADGTGRSFQMWVGDHGWKKFRKAVIAGVHGHAQAYYDNTGAPMEMWPLASNQIWPLETLVIVLFSQLEHAPGTPIRLTSFVL